MGTLALAILALGLLSLGLGAWSVRRDRPPCWRLARPAPVPVSGPGRFETVFEHSLAEGQAHAPAICERPDGFAVIWFEGSAEAQPDVDIHGVEVARRDGGWRVSGPAPVLTRGDLAAVLEPAQLVVTLGNTIEHEGAPGHLLATAVSVGGWAMASVADVAMGRGGAVRARRLDLSPLFNRSFLVRSPMLAYADGTHALPAYFEMGPTFGALVRLDERGRVRDRRRMRAQGTRVIQPMIVALDERRALAFLRDFDRSGVLWLSRTADGGQSWSAPARTARANPSAPVAALSLGRGEILMAANDDPGAPDSLILSLSRDEGTTWREIHRIAGPGMLRYPMLRRAGEEIVLVHSTNAKRGIAVHVFDAAWVARR